MSQQDNQQDTTSSSRRRKSMELESLSFPRDLLRTFTSRDHQTSTQQQQESRISEDEGVSEEIELNLGLSLGGRFGVDKSAKKLSRSSSVIGTMPLVREEAEVAAAAAGRIMRTTSLPAEGEEEWRKRKELQMLRRMEAKRRRSEKQRSGRAVEREGGGGGGGDWAVGPHRQVVLSDVLAQGKAHGIFGGPPGFHAGSSSSGLPEIEGKPFQGLSNCGEASSPASNQMLQERSNQDAVGSSGTKSTENIIKTRSEVENPSRKPHPGQNRGREIGSNSMEDMPCVFTQGTGPNGKRIKGILYRYGRGQEVRIMCVCHGNFLSPAEFVKHAGGGEVAHPLRHIVVDPSSSPYL